MTRLILIRHGQTDYNLENRYCGFSDPPLNDKGIAQAKKLTDELKDLKVDKVYSSDLRRAYETAKIIFRNSSLEKLANFREMNFGIFEGLQYKEIIKKYPLLYRDWVNNPMKVKIPGGEGSENFRKRIEEKLSFILSKYINETIVLVSHGGPIKFILCNALLKFNPLALGNNDSKQNRGVTPQMFWQIQQEVGALNIVDYPKVAAPKIIKMNDTSHLAVQEVHAHE